MQIIPLFELQIENVDIICCNKICRDLQVKLPGSIFIQDYYPFSIGGVDLVLDIK